MYLCYSFFSSSRASSPEQAQNVSLIDDSVLDNNVLGAATSDCKIIIIIVQCSLYIMYSVSSI